jgi:DNA-binding transcriptional ArsR family regulator
MSENTAKTGTAAGMAKASSNGHRNTDAPPTAVEGPPTTAAPPTDADDLLDMNGRRPGDDGYQPFNKRSTYDKHVEESQYGSARAATVVGGLYAAEHGKARGKFPASKGGYDAVKALDGIQAVTAKAVGLIDHIPSEADVVRWYRERGDDTWELPAKASVSPAGLRVAIKGLDPGREIALTTIDALAAQGAAWAKRAVAKAEIVNLDASVPMKDKTVAFTLTELFDKYNATANDLVELPEINPETRRDSWRLLKMWAAAENMRAQSDARKRLAATEVAEIELPPIVSLDDLLAEDDDPVRFRIDGVWPAGGAKVLCAAPAGGGKTTLSGNLVRALADGDPFLGTFAVNQRAEHIVVIDNEMTQGMLKRWLRRQGVANTAAVVDVVNLRGQAGLFDLGNDRLRDRWARRLADLGCDFVVFDCLKPVLEAMGLDENREMGKLLYPLTDMLTAAGVDDVLVHHHMGHANERARGDSTLLGWSDANWKIVRDDDHPLQPRYFSTDKVRDADEPVREGLLSFDAATGRLTYVGGNRATTQQTENVEKRLTAVLDVLADKATEGTDEMNVTEIRQAVGGKKETTDEALALAEKRGLVTRRHQGRAKLYRLNPKARDPYCDDDASERGAAPVVWPGPGARSGPMGQ